MPLLMTPPRPSSSSSPCPAPCIGPRPEDCPAPAPLLSLPFDGEWRVIAAPAPMTSPDGTGFGLTFEAVWPPSCGVPLLAPAAGRVARGPDLGGGKTAVRLEIAPGLHSLCVLLGPLRRGDLAVREGAQVRRGARLGFLRSLPLPRLEMEMREERDGASVPVPFCLEGCRVHHRRETDGGWHYPGRGLPVVGDLLAHCGRTPWMEQGFDPRFAAPRQTYLLHTSEGRRREIIDFGAEAEGEVAWHSRTRGALLRARLRDGLLQPLRYEGEDRSLLSILWNAGAFPLHPLQGMTWDATHPSPPSLGQAGPGRLARLLSLNRIAPAVRARGIGEIVFADAARETFKIRRTFPARPDFLLELTFDGTHGFGLVEGLLKTERTWSHVQRVE